MALAGRWKSELALGCLLTLALCSPAWAYIEPGTSSLLLQGLMGSAAVGILAVKRFWFQIKTVFARLFRQTGAGEK